MEEVKQERELGKVRMEGRMGDRGMKYGRMKENKGGRT